MVQMRMHDQGSISMSDPSHLLWVGDDLPYFQYPGLSLNRHLFHAVFTRRGGVSNPPFNTLNISDTVGDRPKDVSRNLHRIKQVAGADHLIFMNQSHGNNVFVLRKGCISNIVEVPTADAIITNIPYAAIMVKQADCQGVIIFDPTRKVLANVHCGWRGNVQNILGVVIRRMKQEFDCQESDLLAAIGPSLGPCCAEFVTHGQIFPESFERFMVRQNYFDLWAVSSRQLLSAGVLKENIEVAGICSCCNTDLFYSYRAEVKTGRFGTVAMLT